MVVVPNMNPQPAASGNGLVSVLQTWLGLEATYTTIATRSYPELPVSIPEILLASFEFVTDTHT